MIYGYRLLYTILKSLLKLLSIFLNGSSKNWLELRDRKTPEGKQIDSQKTIWFHAASGEIEYSKFIIRELKLRDPNISIVVSYSSPSAEKLFFNIKDYVSEFIPLPWDQPRQIKNLIAHIRPSYMVFSRTDFWPELIYQLQQHQVPFGVVSFIPAEKSFSWILQQRLLKRADFISCLDETSQRRLLNSNPNFKVRVDGDPRFDQVFHRLEQPAKLKLTSSNSIFTAGSIWPEDEEVILPLVPYMLNNKFSCVLSPHDVSEKNVSRLESELKCMNISFIKLSEIVDLQNINLLEKALLIDQIGFLPDCYRFSSFAFVGGSFKEKVHSVMEPLCCGLTVLVGPKYTNNPEAKKYAQSPFNFVQVIHNTEEFTQFLESVKTKTMPSQIALNELKKNKNSSQNIAQFILGKI